ncbi:helix-turn-helix domain-containing protein [Clostridium sp. AWRP]|uniref:helix-turn-helix domain-containing protein n=1 Tax=Clostridium sp. AWRP TaxID=2212991 RepID=UPI000FDC08D4|nr:helix-turn-helix domain-containing protein [Clostridium sp. AWRP]AZV58054.1 hypothetical protein DMR38_16385 [Clostridium sp. AWRP]
MQIDRLKQIGCDRIYEEKVSGIKRERPELNKMLDQIRTGDVIINAARARGKKGGRPKVNDKDIKLAIKMYSSKNYSISEIMKATGVSKTTLYRYINNK